MSKQILGANNAEDLLQSQAATKAQLPAKAVHNYIQDMLVELSQLAADAQLNDLSALLNLTVTAAELNKRLL